MRQLNRIVLGGILAFAASAAGAGDARRGMVVLQFDDGTATHYTNVFPILQKYGLKGSFAVVTGRLGRPGRLTSEQVVALHRSGHEIHDHTLNHDARFWGVHIRDDPGGVPREWETEIRQSLSILTGLGIVTRGWNQPGGQGELWSLELRNLLAKHYDYVAGRVGLPREQRLNFHWNMRDDPLSAGRVLSGTEVPAAEINRQIANGVARGLVCVALFHVVAGPDVDKLDQVCKFVSENRIANLRMADAVSRVTHTGKYVDPRGNQIPNPRLVYDLDRDGRPDGWDGCAYALPSAVPPIARSKVAQLDSVRPAETILYGPETGVNEFSIYLRAPKGKTATVTVSIASMNLSEELQADGMYAYSRQELGSPGPWTVEDKWKRMTHRVAVPARADRIILRISASGTAHMAYPVWKKHR